MSKRIDLGQLKTGDWERLQDIADQFEQAWLAKSDLSETVDLGKFLPALDDSLRSLALIELITTDLEIRWRRGQVISLDWYVEKYPELGPLRALPVKLLYEEYRVRQLHGDRPGLGLYRGRFPAQYAELEQMVHDNPVDTLTLPSQQKTATKTPTPSPSAATDPMRSTAHPMGELGGHLFIKRIGAGSYGEVWKAEAPGGVEVAVKMITRPIEQAEAQQEKQALELMKNLRHAFLAQTHRYEVHEDRLFIVMELADGSLRERLKECLQEGKPGVPVPELIGYMREAAEALDFLHSEKVHHRDIKPENILLLKKHAKVTDFGLARWLECQRDLVTATATGTPAYMAPEVWKGLLSPHSDQYSLAVTYFELRLGRRLYQSKAMIDLMRCHTEDEPDLGPVPPAEQAVLMRALAKEPEQRYANCQEFVQALQEAVAPLLPSSMSSTLIPAMPQLSPRRRRLRAAAFTLAALVPLVLLTVFGKALFFPGNFTVGVPSEVLLTPGETKTISLPIHREGYNGPVQLHFIGAPSGVNVSDAEVPENAESAEVTIEVTPDASPSNGRIAIHAAGGRLRTEAVLEFHVLFLPQGFKPVGEEIATDYNSRKFFKRIAKSFPDGTQVDFVAVPQKQKNLRTGKADPATYYIMENKVWFGLYRKFAEENPGQITGTDWRQKVIDDRQPVLGVTVSDAYNFAVKWFNGNLPTTDQWDKATGYYDEERGEGPYQGSWDHEPKPVIAVGRTKPMKVGEAKDDVSPYGCRDMSGNGLEWTRTLEDGGVLPLIPPPKKNELVLVKLRGRRYTDPIPFRYSVLKNPPDQGSLRYYHIDGELGFRLVIEP